MLDGFQLEDLWVSVATEITLMTEEQMWLQCGPEEERGAGGRGTALGRGLTPDEVPPKDGRLAQFPGGSSQESTKAPGTRSRPAHFTRVKRLLRFSSDDR